MILVEVVGFGASFGHLHIYGVLLRVSGFEEATIVFETVKLRATLRARILLP